MKLYRAIHSFELPAGEPPKWVHLLPLGSFFSGRDGRGPYILKDIQAAQAVIETTMGYQGNADMPIDYDHQLIWTRENGKPAPASGWIKELQARADGVWGRVEWTPRAAELLRNREYRYLSPVFMHTQDGTITRLSFAALSNIPNLELTALASQLAGDKVVTVERGCFRFANAGDVTLGQVGDPAYAVDDQTVSADSNTNTRSQVGVIRDVDAQGVWVEI